MFGARKDVKVSEEGRFKLGHYMNNSVLPRAEATKNTTDYFKVLSKGTFFLDASVFSKRVSKKVLI